MFDALKRHWHELAKERPGRRFQNHYHRERTSSHRRHRVLMLAAGIALVVVGLILLVIPGPGSVLIVVGAALLAQESLATARLLDSAEMHLRRLIRSALRMWHQASTAGKLSAALMSVALVAIAVWFVGRTLMRLT